MKQKVSLIEYLDDTAARLGSKTAFYSESGSCTFRELRELSFRIGGFVAEKSAPRRPIPVLTDRSERSPALFCGILRAGCFYVPLDPEMPEERLKSIINQISPDFILTAGEKKDIPVPQYTLEECLTAEPGGRESLTIDLDPAYMIFTSGSTGAPKGIPVAHRSVQDFALWMSENCNITEEDTLANQAPFFFDLSVKDLWLTIFTGCTTYILPKKLFMFPKLLIKALNDNKITHLNWATSAFNLVASSGILQREAPITVKKVVLGGETLYAKNLNPWRKALPDCTFINLYGPTEVTVDCTMYKVEREFSDTQVVPIGKACRNMEVFLLTEDDTIAPPGTVGEICARGTGIALGYYGDREKTDARFTQNPLCPNYRDIIYRTGDLGTADEEGNITFVARADGQIKHMGYRIELGEVEHAVATAPGVTGAVCFYDNAQGRIVCCYSGTTDREALTCELRRTLPRYMFPNVYRKMEALPMTNGGKVDRVALRKEYENEH